MTEPEVSIPRKSKKGRGKYVREEMVKAKRLALQFKTDNPAWTITRLSREIGRSESQIKMWLQRDKVFLREYRALEAIQHGALPPDPGDFIDWRRRYVNVEKYNPYSDKRSFVGETYPFMIPWLQDLQDPEAGRILALLPVRHGKSTVIEHLIVYYLCRNPDARIQLICRTIGMAEERLHMVRQMLEDVEQYPDLHQRWGMWVGKPDSTVTARSWSARRLYIRGHTGKDRSPSVECLGITSNIYGKRADLTICDDLDDPDTEMGARVTMLRTINGVLINRLDQGGKLVVIGTRCGPGDIYGSLIEGGRYRTHIAKAIQDDGTALCPEMYGIEELEQFRAETDFYDPALFLMSYQNEVSSPLDAMFTPEMLDKAKGDYTLGEAPDDWPRTIVLDPAATGTAAVVTLAHKGDDIRVLDCVSHRAPGYKGIYDMLAGAIFRHHPKVCVIEESGATFITDYPAIDLLLKEHGVSMQRFHTGSNKVDRRFGVGLLKSRFELGLLTYAYGDTDAMQTMRPLVNELLTWRPTGRSPKDHHWDRTMALWMGVNVICTGTWSRFAHYPVVYDPLVTRHPYMMAKRQREAAGATKMHVQDQYRQEMLKAGVTSSQHL